MDIGIILLNYEEDEKYINEAFESLNPVSN